MLSYLTITNDRAQLERAQESLKAGRRSGPDGGGSVAWFVVEPSDYGFNAAQALNYGLDQIAASTTGAASEWVACVHQDLLFPDGWHGRFSAALAALPKDAAVAGIVGTQANGRYRGHILDPNGHCYWPSLPAPVSTLDECVLALRVRSGLRFDEATPGFHCYGADLCLQARAAEHSVWAVDAPLQHLSTGTVDEHYERASAWLMEKWGATHGHVLATPAMLLQDEERASFLHRFAHRLRRRKDRLARNKNAQRVDKIVPVTPGNS